MTCLPAEFPLFLGEGCWQAVRLCIGPCARTVINCQGEGDREAACGGEDKGGAFIPEAGFQSLVRGRGDYTDLPGLETSARLDKQAALARLKSPIIKNLNVWKIGSGGVFGASASLKSHESVLCKSVPVYGYQSPERQAFSYESSLSSCYYNETSLPLWKCYVAPRKVKTNKVFIGCRTWKGNLEWSVC